jgi:hypothetical protein
MSETQKTAALWGGIAFLLAIVMVTHNNSAMVLGAGFFAKTFAVVVGTGLGTLGALLGDAIRRFALPDAFYTTGGMGSILKTKLFWMIGPQAIGVLVGVALGASLVLS